MVLADTGYWVAWPMAGTGGTMRRFLATRQLDEQLIVTWPVLTETCHLLLSRLGSVCALRFLEQVAVNVEIHEIEADRLDRLHALMVKYRGLPMDLADASLALAADDLGVGRILSTDARDCNTYRWKEREPFTNLLGIS